MQTNDRTHTLMIQHFKSRAFRQSSNITDIYTLHVIAVLEFYMYHPLEIANNPTKYNYRNLTQ